jgi:hypothetical protein
MSLAEEELRLCSKCVNDGFLRRQIEHKGLDAGCSYCKTLAPTVSIGEVADEVEIALKEHFYRTATEASGSEYAMMKEGDLDWERKGDPVIDVIEESAGIDRKVAEDIQKVLQDRHFDFDLAAMGEENPFDEDAHYASSNVDAAESLSSWRHFENSLKTQARYFSTKAEAVLASIFEGIADHQRLHGNPVIVEAGPGKELTALYRARVFQSDEKLENSLKRPDRDLGPPPSNVAASGRMNARGISVFYGATDPLVALAEVRPPVGSKAMVARFELVRLVQLLDVEALRTVVTEGSVFDRTYIRRLERAEFLKWLSHRITTPVMPDDEPFEYLATQAVADFLGGSTNPPLDGMLYRSVQGGNGKLNVVLFHKAARIQPLDLPSGTVLDSQLYFDTEDSYEMYPWVYEILPEKKATEKASSGPAKSVDLEIGEERDLPDPTDLISCDPSDLDPEGREPTLKLDVSTVTIHLIKAVAFESESYPVHRHRH